MKSKKGKRVLTYGTFDVLHRGHIRLLKRAKRLGEYLLVAISTDGFNRVKGKSSVFPYRERKWILEHLEMVDEVIPEKNWVQKINDVKKHKIDVFVMGDDWRGKFDFLKPYCRVVYLKRTVGISTTQIKQRMAAVKKL
jgi:glycerol-3-phosphate cytidylyltransferase